MAAGNIDPEARPERAGLRKFGRLSFAVLCVSVALIAALWLLFGGEETSGPPDIIAAEQGRSAFARTRISRTANKFPTRTAKSMRWSILIAKMWSAAKWRLQRNVPLRPRSQMTPPIGLPPGRGCVMARRCSYCRRTQRRCGLIPRVC